MAILNVPATYALPSDAALAASSGDTILIQPGTYAEGASVNFPAGVIVTGAGTTPAAVVITRTGTVVNVNRSGDCFLNNLTIHCASTSGSAAALKGGNLAEVYATNVYFTSAGVSCVTTTDAGSTYTNCLFSMPMSATAANMDGFRSISSNPCILKGCVFIGWTGMAINAESSIAINCSAYEDMDTATPTHGFNLGSSHNNAVWAPNTTTYGVRTRGAGQTMGYTSCWVSGVVTSLYVSSGSTSDGGNYTANNIATNGYPLFVNPPTNMEPHADGLAFQNGNNAYALPSTDFAGNAWNNPPSRGAYEEAPIPSSGGGGSGKDSLNNLTNLNNFNSLN